MYLHNEVSTDPCGMGYKTATNRLKLSSAPSLLTDTMKDIVDKLFLYHAGGYNAA